MNDNDTYIVNDDRSIYHPIKALPHVGRIFFKIIFQGSVGRVAPDSMVRRIYQCMCNISLGEASSPAPGTSPTSAASGVGVVRDQLVIFLADTLRGTAEERAPLVMSMIQLGAGAAKCHQVAEVSRWKIKYAISGSSFIKCWSQQLISMRHSLFF